MSHSAGMQVKTMKEKTAESLQDQRYQQVSFQLQYILPPLAGTAATGGLATG